MTQALLKAKLIAAIEATDEQDLLEAVYALLSSTSFGQDNQQRISNEQYTIELTESREQGRRGEVINHDDVEKKLSNL